MQQFLVPVDFSPASRNALQYAAQLAQSLHGRLLLFNAFMLPTPVSEVPYMMVTAEELQKEQEARIKEEANRLRNEFGITVDTIVRLGIASDEIRLLCQEQAIDWVMMGMKGESGMEKIIGSTTTNVVRKVKTPVWVIPHDARYQPLDVIVYATDFSDQAGHHMYDPLLQLAQSFGSAVRIFHVQQNHGGEQAAHLMRKKEIEQAFRSIPHEFIHHEHHSVTQGVNEYVSRHPANLLVMVAHKHTFFERIFSKNHTTAMAYETHLPLLILQDKG